MNDKKNHRKLLDGEEINFSPRSEHVYSVLGDNQPYPNHSIKQLLSFYLDQWQDWRFAKSFTNLRSETAVEAMTKCLENTGWDEDFKEDVLFASQSSRKKGKLKFWHVDIQEGSVRSLVGCMLEIYLQISLRIMGRCSPTKFCPLNFAQC